MAPRRNCPYCGEQTLVEEDFCNVCGRLFAARADRIVALGTSEPRPTSHKADPAPGGGSSA